MKQAAIVKVKLPCIPFVAMSRVYVSSTFRDLRECRGAVEEAVRMLGHQDVAMEHYGAEPRPPLDKCLADVEASDIYIGIVGRRYGWIPPGSTQSITEQEYRQAVRSRKPILAFVLDADVSDWPETAAETSAHQAALQKFREDLSTTFLAGRFSSCDKLAIKVIAALANLGATPSTLYDPEREDRLLDLLQSTDSATRTRARRGLVDMGSAAYAAQLRRQLRSGRRTSDERSADVRELAEIESRNHRVMPILRDLFNSDDPSTLAAVVFEFAQRALQRKSVGDDDVLAILKLGGHESADVRREVAHSMWKFLPRPRQVLEKMRVSLDKLAGDPNRDVSATAMFSLSKVHRAEVDG